MVDPDEVDRIVRNLLENAVRYGGDGVTIDIRTWSRDGDVVPRGARRRPRNCGGRHRPDLRPVLPVDRPGARSGRDRARPDSIAQDLARRNGGRLSVASSPGAGRASGSPSRATGEPTGRMEPAERGTSRSRDDADRQDGDPVRVRRRPAGGRADRCDRTATRSGSWPVHDDHPIAARRRSARSSRPGEARRGSDGRGAPRDARGHTAQDTAVRRDAKDRSGIRSSRRRRWSRRVELRVRRVRGRHVDVEHDAAVRRETHDAGTMDLRDEHAAVRQAGYLRSAGRMSAAGVAAHTCPAPLPDDVLCADRSRGSGSFGCRRDDVAVGERIGVVRGVQVTARPIRLVVPAVLPDDSLRRGCRSGR